MMNAKVEIHGEGTRFLRFLAAGAAAAGVNFGSRFVFSVWLPYPWAITCAYLLGMVTAFFFMRQYVFAGRGKAIGPQAVKFAIVNGLALLQTLVVSLLLARWLLPAMGFNTHSEAIGHAFGVAIPIVTSYLGHRYATFK